MSGPIDAQKLVREQQEKATQDEIAELLGKPKTEGGDKGGDDPAKDTKGAKGKGSSDEGSEDAEEGGKGKGKSDDSGGSGGADGEKGAKKDEKGTKAEGHGSEGEAGKKGTSDEEKQAKKSKEDSKKAEDVDPEIVALKAQNAALLGQVESLSVLGLKRYTEEGGAKPKEGDGKASDKESAGKKSESVEFVTEKELENVLESADSFNIILNKVANAAALAGEQRGYERAVRDTPKLVSKLTGEQITARDTARDFLDANPDLKPVRSFVGMIANELQAQHPDWDMKTLFEKAGEETRKRLSLSKDASKLNKDEGAEEDPSLPKRGAGGGGGTRSTKGSNLTELQKDIGNLIGYAEGSSNR